MSDEKLFYTLPSKSKALMGGIFEALPYDAIEDLENISNEFGEVSLPVIKTKDNTYSLVYSWQGIGYEEFDEEKRLEIRRYFAEFMATLPAYTRLQFIYDFQMEKKDIKTDFVADDDLLLKEINIQEQSTIEKVLFQKCYFIIGFNLKYCKNSETIKEVLKKKPKKNNLLDVVNILTKLKLSVNYLFQNLKIYGINGELLNKDSIYNFLYSQLNFVSMSEAQKYKYNDTGSFQLNSDLINTDYQFKKNEMLVGEKNIKIHSLLKKPDYTNSFLDSKINGIDLRMPFLKNLFYDLNFPHRIVLNITIADKEIIKKQLETENTKNGIFQYKLFRNLMKDKHLVDIENRENFINFLVDGHNCAYMSISCIIWDEDSKGLKLKEKLLEDKAAGIAGMRFTTKSLDLLTSYIGLLPGNQLNDFNKLIFLDENVYNIVNFLDYYNTNEKKGALSFNRKKQPFKKNSLCSPTNNNILCVGGSGAGKSVKTALSLMDYAQQGHEFLVIDHIESYLKFFKIINGTIYAFSPENPFPMNVFNFSKNEYTIQPKGTFDAFQKKLKKSGKDKELKHILTSEESEFEIVLELNKIKTIKEFIFLQMRNNGDEFLPKPLDTIISKVLDEFIFEMLISKKKKKLSDFLEVLLKNKKNPEFVERVPNFSVFIYNLEAFLNDRVNRAYFDTTESFNIGNDKFLYYELSHLANNENLKVSVFLQLFSKINEFVARPTVTHIRGEEQWNLMKQKTVDFPGLLEDLGRTIRKRNGTLGLISQEPKDFAPLSGFLSNCAHLEILEQAHSSSAFEDCQKIFNLNNNTVQILKSLRMQAGEYSEVFNSMTTKKGIVHFVERVYLPRFMYWLFTSNKEEKINVLDPAIAKYGGPTRENIIKGIKDIVTFEQGEKHIF